MKWTPKQLAEWTEATNALKADCCKLAGSMVAGGWNRPASLEAIDSLKKQIDQLLNAAKSIPAE